MTPSSACAALVRQFEGLRLAAYQDSVGVWTIGYGHTGTDVRPGMTITNAQADDLLRIDLGKAGRDVARVVTVPVSQGQFDALTSFAFNLGGRALAGSTLLRLLNAGDPGAAAQFDRWNQAGGQVLAGLVRRRAAERAMFEGR